MTMTVPEDLQPTLDEIKNQITMGEAEVIRLRDLKQAEEYAVSELVKAKKWNEEENERLVSENEALTKKIEARKQEFDEASALVEEAKSVQADQERREQQITENHEASLLAIEKERADKLADLDERERVLTESEQSAADAAEATDAKAETLSNKLSVLKEAIENVQQEL